MSDHLIDEDRTLGRVEAVEVQAANWILAKQMSDAWSDTDQSALNAWLSESTSHVAAYWRLEDTWARTRRLKALHQPFVEPSSRPIWQKRSKSIGAAAVFAIGVVVTGSLWNGYTHRDVKTYSTPIGGHLGLSLTDGSKIELNTDTKLSFLTSAGQRSANLLKGEALFDIKHNASVPFVLFVGKHQVTDLGTKFLVRSENGKVKVSLLEGKARFDLRQSDADAQSTDLTPGDVVVATADSMSVSRKSDKQLMNQLGWRRGLLIFENTTLADAASELNRYNIEKIIIRDPAVAKLTIGGKFFENDVSALLNTAQQVFGLSVSRRGNEILISR